MNADPPYPYPPGHWWALRSLGVEEQRCGSWWHSLLLRAGDIEENPGPEDYQLRPDLFISVVNTFNAQG